MGVPALAWATENPDSTLVQSRLSHPNDTTTLATVKVGSDIITLSPSATLDEAVKGHLAGYYNNGEIRGMQSQNGSPILLVLDGVPSTTLTLSDIDPLTVESVEILKDAAAKAIYGPLGAQGVIVVNTKRGFTGNTIVKVTANFAFQKPTKTADMVDGYQYATLRNQALANDGLASAFSADQLSLLQSGQGYNNNWRDQYLHNFRTAQRYSISLTGGNERVKYYVNGGFEHETGLYKTDWKEKYDPTPWTNRFNVTSNMDIKMFPFLSAWMYSSMRITRENGSDSDYDIINLCHIIPPTTPGGVVDGKIVTDENFANPIYGEINYSGAKETTGTNINANFGLNLDLNQWVKGLSLQGILGYNSKYTGVRHGSYDYSRYVSDGDGGWSLLGTQREAALSWSKASTAIYFMNFQGRIKYQREFGKNYVSANLTYLSEDKLNGSTSTGWLLPFSRIQLSGEVKYGFDNRYYVQASFNHAGSEQLPKGNQFHFSPAGSVSWNAHNESFLRQVTWLNQLKLRASAGILQYDNLWNFPSRYLYADEYRQQGGGGVIGSLYSYAHISEGLLGNPTLTWEKTYEQNYGIDLRVLNSLSLSVDYFRSHLNRMLCVDNTTPTAGGHSTSTRAYTNIGRTHNQGVDVSARYTGVIPSADHMTINGYVDLGWNKNRIDYAGDLDYSSSGYAYPSRTSGYSIGQQFGYLVDGSNGSIFYNSQNEIDNCGLTFAGREPRPGDLKFQDLNGDGVIDECDKAPLDGVKTMPSFNYGFGAQVMWRGFDLYLYFQGETGRNQLYSCAGVYENSYQGVYVNGLHTHAWTAERYAAGQDIRYPALTSSNSSSLQDNSFFVSKADYIRLRNLVLGYSLPTNTVQKLKLTQLRFYFAAENLFTSTNMKFKSFDPESTGLSDYLYRSFSIGLNLSF